MPLNKETSSLLKRFPPSVRPHRAILPLNAKVSPIPLQREGEKEKGEAKEKAGRGEAVTDTLASPSERLGQCNESPQQQPTELSLMRACVCRAQRRACARQPPPAFHQAPFCFCLNRIKGCSEMRGEAICPASFPPPRKPCQRQPLVTGGLPAHQRGPGGGWGPGGSHSALMGTGMLLQAALPPVHPQPSGPEPAPAAGRAEPCRDTGKRRAGAVVPQAHN